MLGYRRREPLVTAGHDRRVRPGGGMLRPVVLIDGLAAGTWGVRVRAGQQAVTVDWSPAPRPPPNWTPRWAASKTPGPGRAAAPRAETGIHHPRAHGRAGRPPSGGQAGARPAISGGDRTVGQMEFRRRTDLSASHSIGSRKYPACSSAYRMADERDGRRRCPAAIRRKSSPTAHGTSRGPAPRPGRSPSDRDRS